jgi:hypothetical protein
VKISQEQAPAVLGLTRKEFNKKCLAAAVAIWGDTREYLARVPDASKQRDELWDAYHHLADLTNLHQILQETGSDLKSNRGFKILSTTKAAFEADLRDAMVSFLTLTKKYNGKHLTHLSDEPLDYGRKVCGIDPNANELYQEAGFTSRADFDTHYSAWKKAIDSSSGHGCCGHDHHHGPN